MAGDIDVQGLGDAWRVLRKDPGAAYRHGRLGYPTSYDASSPSHATPSDRSMKSPTKNAEMIWLWLLKTRKKEQRWGSATSK